MAKTWMILMQQMSACAAYLRSGLSACAACLEEECVQPYAVGLCAPWGMELAVRGALHDTWTFVASLGECTSAWAAGFPRLLVAWGANWPEDASFDRAQRVLALLEGYGYQAKRLDDAEIAARMDSFLRAQESVPEGTVLFALLTDAPLTATLLTQE